MIAASTGAITGGTGEKMQRWIRATDETVLPDQVYTRRIQEIEELRTEIDRREYETNQSPLAQFIGIVQSRARAYVSKDQLIAQPASTRLGVSELYNMSIFTPTATLIQQLAVGDQLRGLANRIEAANETIRDEALANASDTSLSAPDAQRLENSGLEASNLEQLSEALDQVANGEGIITPSQQEAIAQSLNSTLGQTVESLRTADVLSDSNDSLLPPGPLSPGSTNPNEPDAADMTLLVEFARKLAATPSLRRFSGVASKAQLIVDIGEQTQNLGPDGPGRASASSSNGLASQTGAININVEAGNNVDADTLRELISIERQSILEEVEMARQVQLERIRSADQRVTKERNEHLAKLSNIASMVSQSGDLRPSLILQGAMSAALSRICRVNDSFRPLLASRRMRSLWASRDGELVTNFALATAAAISEPSSLTRYSSQMANATLAQLGEEALVWFQHYAFYDPSTKRVKVLRDGRTTADIYIRGRAVVPRPESAAQRFRRRMQTPHFSYQREHIQVRRIQPNRMFPR